MRLVIITNGNFFARVILSRTLRELRTDIAGIIVVTGVFAKRSRLQSLKAILTRSGWRHFIYKAGTYVTFFLASVLWPRRAYFVPQLARQIGIPIRYIDQIDSIQAQSLVENWKPDILVSVSCPQRIPRRMLSTARCYAINIHSSLLPAYAGVSPYIWVLANGERTTGTTVHIMEPEFDTGAIIVQKELAILPHDSAFSLFYRLSVLGESALFEAIMALQTSEPDLTPQPLNKRTYFSWPTKQTINDLLRCGHRLAHLKDFLDTIGNTYPDDA